MLPYRSTKVPQADVSLEASITQQNLEMKRVQNAINLTGGQRVAPRVITSASPCASTDGVIYADTTGGAVAATLLKAVEYLGLVLAFKKVAGANAFTVVTRGADTILDNTGTSVASITVTNTTRWLHAVNQSTWAEL